MIYLPEPYYFQDQPDFPLQQAVDVTTPIITNWEAKFCFSANDLESDAWFLDLSPERFSELQTIWEQHDLPRDLFYPEVEVIREGIKIYSPKRWQTRSK